VPISIEKRYEQMFAQLRFASEMKFKILAAWGAVYAALAAVFAWMQSSDMKPMSWLAPALGFLVTILFWLADLQNQPALGAAKKAGQAIEEDQVSEIPENQRYFHRLEKGVRFGVIVNFFAISMLVLLGIATAYLWGYRADLPK
jgi:hypothetical protein